MPKNHLEIFFGSIFYQKIEKIFHIMLASKKETSQSKLSQNIIGIGVGIATVSLVVALTAPVAVPALVVAFGASSATSIGAGLIGLGLVGGGVGGWFLGPMIFEKVNNFSSEKKESPNIAKKKEVKEEVDEKKLSSVDHEEKNIKIFLAKLIAFALVKKLDHKKDKASIISKVVSKILIEKSDNKNLEDEDVLDVLRIDAIKAMVKAIESYEGDEKQAIKMAKLAYEENLKQPKNPNQHDSMIRKNYNDLFKELSSRNFSFVEKADFSLSKGGTSVKKSVEEALKIIEERLGRLNSPSSEVKFVNGLPMSGAYTPTSFSRARKTYGL